MSIQSGPGRIVLLALFLSVLLVFAASAACPGTKLVVLSPNVTIENAGAVTPGTSVAMSVRVDFPDKENSTYPETSQLELTSGLDSPSWTWNIVREGKKRPETEERGGRVIISGSDLSYPANTSESVEIRLYGTAPSVVENKNLTVMRIQDIASTACIGEVYRYNAWVLNTIVTRERIDRLYDKLSRLRAFAAAKHEAGTNTTMIMEKFDEAKRSLDEANSTPVFEFVSIEVALNRTEAAIEEGERLLNKEPYGNIVVEHGGTPVPKKLPATSPQTPASPVTALLPALAVIAAGCYLVMGRRKKDQ